MPEVQSKTGGVPVTRAIPSAKKPAARSSRIEWSRSEPLRAAASAKGVEREPGLTTTSRAPADASASIRSSAQTLSRFRGSPIQPNVLSSGTFLPASTLGS